jgi:hypothetical protein
MPNKVFISYRREDSRYQAQRIYNAFVKALSPGAVFMDVDTIPLGADFVETLEGWVQQCDVLLALIGPNWLNLIDPRTGLRRLDNPDDFVRIEIRGALARKIPVVPVLLDATEMPAAAQLPDDIKGLQRRHAGLIDFRTFDADLQRLIERLRVGEKIELPAEQPVRKAADNIRHRTVIAELNPFSRSIEPGIVAARKSLAAAAALVGVLAAAYLIGGRPTADAPEEARRAAEARADDAVEALKKSEKARQEAETRTNNTAAALVRAEEGQRTADKARIQAETARKDAEERLNKSDRARQEAEARFAGFFLTGIGSSSRWALDGTANCGNRDQSYYYSMTSSADTITWTNGSGDVDVETIISTGTDEFRTRTQKSRHVNSDENIASGTTWTFSRQGERMRVQSSLDNDYFLARCP